VDPEIQKTLTELDSADHCNWNPTGWYVESIDAKYGCMPSNWTNANDNSGLAQNSCTPDTDCPGTSLGGTYTSVDQDGNPTSTVLWETLSQSMCKATLTSEPSHSSLAAAQQACIDAGTVLVNGVMQPVCGGVMESAGMVPGMQDWSLASDAVMCASDGGWYCASNPACTLSRTCFSNSGLQMNACPFGPVLWGVNSGNSIYYTTSTGPSGTTWNQVPGSLKQIAVQDNTVWGVNSNNQIYWNTKLSTGGTVEGQAIETSFAQLPPTTGHVHVAPIDGEDPLQFVSEMELTEVDAVVQEGSKVGSTRRRGKGKTPPPPQNQVTWYNVPGALKQLSLNSNTVWGVNSANQAYFATVTGTLHYVSDCSLCGQNLCQNYFIDSKLPDTWTLSPSNVGSSGFPCSSLDLNVQKIVRNTESSPCCQIFVLVGGDAQKGEWTGLSTAKMPPGGFSYITASPSGSMVWGLNTSDAAGNQGIYTTIGGTAHNSALTQGSGNPWKLIPGKLKQLSAGDFQIWGVDSNDDIFYAYSRAVLHPLNSTQVSDKLCDYDWAGQHLWWDESTQGSFPTDWIKSPVDVLYWGCNYVTNRTGVVKDSSGNLWAVENSQAWNGQWAAAPQGGQLKMVEVTGNLIWGVNSADDIYYSTGQSQWIQIPGGLSWISASTKAATPPMGAPPSYFLCNLPYWSTYNIKVMSSGTDGFTPGACVSTYPFNGSRRRRGKVMRLNSCDTGSSAQGWMFTEIPPTGPTPATIKTGYIKSPGGQCLVPYKDKSGSYVTLTNCGSTGATGQQWVFNSHLNQLKSNNGGYCLDAACDLNNGRDFATCVGNQAIEVSNCDSTNLNQQWELEGAKTVWGPSSSSTVYLKGPNTVSNTQLTQSGCTLTLGTCPNCNTGSVKGSAIGGLRDDVHGMNMPGTLSGDGHTITWSSYPSNTYWKNNQYAQSSSATRI